MRAAILQCDEVLDKFQPQFGMYYDMIRHMFETVDGAFEFDNFDCRQGRYPDDINLYDFYITTGSKVSVYEDEPWIHKLITFVQQLDSHKKKLIGICFGHQIISMAYHKQVVKSDKGWGIGVVVNRIVAAPDWMSEKRHEFNLIASHQDQVTTLPEGAVVIAKSDFCPFFMVQWNDHFLSVQGHPEWNTAYSRTLINNKRAIIPSERIESGLESLSIKPDNELLARWIVDFVKF
jgi:GMP synthase-like glutamine amidotransferase